MSHDHGPKTEVHSEEAVTHDVAPPARMFAVFFILAGLSVGALLVGFQNDLGPWKIAANLCVSTIQASILALYFMDLKEADKVTWLIALSGVFFTGLMFLFTLTDYLTRYMGVL